MGLHNIMPIAKTRLRYIILYPTVYPVGISPRARLRRDLHAWLLQLCRLRSLQVSDLQTSRLHKHYGRGHFVTRHQTLWYLSRVTKHCGTCHASPNSVVLVTRHQTLWYLSRVTKHCRTSSRVAALLHCLIHSFQCAHR